MSRNAAIFRELIISVTVINLAVLVAFVVLTVLQFDQIRTGLEQERLAVVSERVSEPLSSAAAIGLQLSSVRNLPALLERAKQVDEAIVDLHVLDKEGNVVASTRREGEIADVEITKVLQSGETEVAIRNGRDFRYLVSFQNSEGDLAGALLMEYSGAEANTSVWAMAGQLSTAALLFSALSSLLSIFVVRKVLQPEIEISNAYSSANDQLDMWLWRGHQNLPPVNVTTEIEQALREADQRYRKLRGTAN